MPCCVSLSTGRHPGSLVEDVEERVRPGSHELGAVEGGWIGHSVSMGCILSDLEVSQIEIPKVRVGLEA